jgi:hypothetical protein
MIILSTLGANVLFLLTTVGNALVTGSIKYHKIFIALFTGNIVRIIYFTVRYVS